MGGLSAVSGAFRELFEACRNGDVSRVRRLLEPGNVNAKDMAGRKSTPLHFAAGPGGSGYMRVLCCSSHKLSHGSYLTFSRGLVVVSYGLGSYWWVMA